MRATDENNLVDSTRAYENKVVASERVATKSEGTAERGRDNHAE